VILEGGDRGAFPGLEGEHCFARALPLEKALDGDVILAWAMNHVPLTQSRGGPVRAIVPGWYATDSIKWLARVAFAEGPWGGPFEALDYRLREAGTDGAGKRMTALPVSSLVTSPEAGAPLSPGAVTIRGIAWGGRAGIARVEVRIDDGPSMPGRLIPGEGPYARTLWECRCRLEPGQHLIASRAVDGAGATQPEWPVANAAGYGNNSVHRVEVTVS
jgi:DMSO/TMAO reductase YedYZ molybdopterin-dependent catalytic subunit